MPSWPDPNTTDNKYQATAGYYLYNGSGCSSTPTGPYYYLWCTSSSCVIKEGSGTGPVTVIRSGTNPPGWRQKIGRDIVPYTDREVSRTRWSYNSSAIDPASCYSYKSGSYWYSRKWYGKDAVLQYVSVPNTTWPLSPDLDSLLQEAWASAKSDGYQVMVDLAERKQTLDLFRTFNKRYGDRLAKVKNLALKKRRGDWRKLVKRGLSDVSAANEILANTWLEYRYGWRQLVFSANDIVEAYDKLRTDDLSALVRGTAKSNTQTVQSPITSLYYIKNNPGEGSFSLLSQTRTKTRYGRASVIVKVVAPRSTNILDINPVSTAWELVPWSFVVDWFVNTADIFSAHWPSTFVAGSTSSTSLKDEDHTRLTFKGSSSQWTHLQDGEFNGYDEHYTRLNRDSTGIPWVLSYRPRLTRAKILDLAALAVTNRARLVKSVASKFRKG